MACMVRAGLTKSAALNRVAGPLRGDVLPQRRGQFGRPHRRAAAAGFTSSLVEGEEAVAQLAVGGQPQAVAAVAERPADAGDDAELQPGCRRRRSPSPGRRGRSPRPGRAGRPRARSPPATRAAGTTLSRSHALRADRHVLDEPQLEAVVAAEPGQRHHVGVDEAADGDGVHLDRREPGGLRGQQPVEDLLDAVAAGQLAEAAGVERVERDVDPLQPGAAQRRRPASPAAGRWWSARCR